ncbi:MAG: hypothetical protein H3C38_16790 [Rhodospirillales bacterium]|nr:hypothetical protein [Rhodospirillales bacterium]
MVGTTIRIAAAASFAVLASANAFAHDPRGGWGSGWDGGMMGHGMMGPGMMGPGMMGPGWGGPGMMMGPGMMGMGPGMGPGMMGQGAPCWGSGGQPAALDLKPEDVRQRLERQLAWMGNPRLQVGKVAEADANTITAEIVTKEGTLVDRFAVDRATGASRRID